MPNPLTLIALGFIRLYRLILSPWMGNQCRFHPTCSHYAEEAFLTHGFFKGLYLTVWRIVRCAPWGRGPWIDPVPQKNSDARPSNSRFAWLRAFRYNEPNPNYKSQQGITTSTEQKER